MCTITSLISGRSLRIRSSISLARAWASASEVPGSSDERQVGEQPVVGAQEAQLARRLAGLLAHDPLDEVAVAVDALALGGLGQRLEVRLHRVHLRHRLDDRALDLGGDLVRVLERQLAGELEVERDLGRVADPHDAQVVDLAHARDPLRRGERPLAQGRLVLLRLDVDDDVAVGQRPVHRVLDRVGRGVALADRRARRDGDHDVRELLPRGLAHPQAPQLDPGQRPDRGQRRLLRVGRDPVHQDVDVDAHQPSRGEQHEPGHEQRRRRVGPVVALARGDEAEQHGRRAGEVAREVERVRLQRRAPVAAAGAVRDGRAHGVDDDHDRRPRAAPSRVGSTWPLASPNRRQSARQAISRLATTRIAASASAARCSALPWP